MAGARRGVVGTFKRRFEVRLVVTKLRACATGAMVLARLSMNGFEGDNGVTEGAVVTDVTDNANTRVAKVKGKLWPGVNKRRRKAATCFPEKMSQLKNEIFEMYYAWKCITFNNAYGRDCQPRKIMYSWFLISCNLSTGHVL